MIRRQSSPACFYLRCSRNVYLSIFHEARCRKPSQSPYEHVGLEGSINGARPAVDDCA